jgi:phage shock protein PspC (stress-responsive transcriptional regulator)
VGAALLADYAYERAGVVAAIAVHFGVNATVAVLTVKSPVTQAFVLAVQVVVVVVLHQAASRRR